MIKDVGVSSGQRSPLLRSDQLGEWCLKWQGQQAGVLILPVQARISGSAVKEQGRAMHGFALQGLALAWELMLGNALQELALAW